MKSIYDAINENPVTPVAVLLALVCAAIAGAALGLSTDVVTALGLVAFALFVTVVVANETAISEGGGLMPD